MNQDQIILEQLYSEIRFSDIGKLLSGKPANNPSYAKRTFEIFKKNGTLSDGDGGSCVVSGYIEDFLGHEWELCRSQYGEIKVFQYVEPEGGYRIADFDSERPQTTKEWTLEDFVNYVDNAQSAEMVGV